MSKYKAILITKGYAQTYDLDYDETYSLVAKMMTIRVIIIWKQQKDGFYIKWM